LSGLHLSNYFGKNIGVTGVYFDIILQVGGEVKERLE
jgi:hypothetical protein